MRIAFLSPYLPCPVRHGGQNRTLGLIRCLTRFASVEVLAIGDPRASDVDEARSRLEALGARLSVFQATGPGPAEADAPRSGSSTADPRRLPIAAAHFRSPALREALAALEPDVLHVEEMAMAQYAGVVRCSHVIDRQKVEWLYHAALSRSGGDGPAGHALEAARFRSWEGAMRGRFAKVLVTGPADREALIPFHGSESVHVVPIGVDERISRPQGRTAEIRHVLLYGTLDYPPNTDANELYLRDVWPLLRGALPDLRTLVVGSGRAPASLSLDRDARVELRGYVPEVASVLAGPGVLVVPLRVGGGSRTKVLEALAAGMPVVSTRIGVENLGLTPGRHYLEAETRAAMAAAIERLVRDPPLAAALGREGAAHVDAGFRWEGIGRSLEPIYASLARPRPTRSARTRVLLVGVGPCPSDLDGRGHSFAGHRTEQFHRALSQAECQTEVVLLDEEGAGGQSPGRRLLGREEYLAGRELRSLCDRFQPELVVSAGGLHAARAVAGLETERPRWIDLPGDLAAEGQLVAERSPDGAALEHLAVLSRALLEGDFFSVVGSRQRLALLGQLGLSGRLTGGTVGRDPVAVVEVASAGPPQPPPLPETGLRLLSSGGYNTWMDTATLFAGLEEAMSRRDDISFHSTGGVVPRHDETSYAAFWQRAGASRFAARFEDLGRLSRRDSLEAIARSHVLLCVSRACLETELGSRQRLVEGMAHGRVVVATDLGDLATDVREAGAGLVVPAGDAHGLADALVYLAERREELVACARNARSLWERRWTYEATTAPLRAWVRQPARWPRSFLAVSEGAALQRQLLGLQADLAQIRSSRTFGMLRFFDRLLRRGALRRAPLKPPSRSPK